MGQLVEADLTDLGTLPLCEILLSLNVGELNCRNNPAFFITELPSAQGHLGRCSLDALIDFLGFVPQTALCEDLIEVAAEDRTAKAFDILVSQR